MGNERFASVFAVLAVCCLGVCVVVVGVGVFGVIIGSSRREFA
jgi:hypothetical protein